ncbi:MAG: GDP-mannose 4,6-dehydratase [Rhodoferax sp.]|nr:GDP-mannose 4,6-dehydratase [Rhodoferax sp.]
MGGQDGAYLAQLLLSKGYEVVGSSRDADMLNRDGLRSLGIEDKVRVVSMASNDFRSVLQTPHPYRCRRSLEPGRTDLGGLSFEQPVRR